MSGGTSVPPVIPEIANITWGSDLPPLLEDARGFHRQFGRKTPRGMETHTREPSHWHRNPDRDAADHTPLGASMTWSWTAPFTLWPTLPGAPDGTGLPLVLRVDELTLVMLAIGLVAGLVHFAWRTGLSRRTDVAWSLLLYGGAAAVWCVDTVWLVLVLQAGLLALGAWRLGSVGDDVAAGPAARGGWLTATVTDVAWLLVALCWTFDAPATTFTMVGEPAFVVGLQAQGPAYVGALALLLWLGTWGRALQFPCGLSCDQVRHLSAAAWGPVWITTQGLVTARWLSIAAAWFPVVPETAAIIQGGTALAGLSAAWFALCSRDPRVRIAWLLTIPWSLAMSMLTHPAGTAPALALIAGSILLAAWWTAPWESAHSAAADPLSNASTTRVTMSSPAGFATFFATSMSGRLRSDGPWAETLKLVTGGDAEPIGSHDAGHADMPTARGGRLGIFVGACVALVTWTLLGDLVEPTSGTPAQTITDSLTTTGGAPSPRSTPLWPLAARWGTFCLAAITIVRLIVETRRPLGERWSMIGIALGGVVLWIGPAVVLALAGFQFDPSEWIAVGRRIALVMGVVAAGLLIGAWSVRSGVTDGRWAWFEPWARLGRRRLYLGTLLLFGVNLPLRALAQLTRFWDWFAWDTLFLGAFRRLPRMGADEGLDLHQVDLGFYALSLGVGTAAVTLTLLWLGL